MTLTGRRRKGNRGEALAVAALEKAGYTILDRNWRVALGELDIVARQGEEVVFVEVRSALGGIDSALESVSARKRIKLTKLAYAYLDMHDLTGTPFRIDVAAVSYVPEQVEIIENAVGW